MSSWDDATGNQEDSIMQLKNKVVIVTGASKGLGVSMARVCAAEGAKVVLAARTKRKLDALAAELKKARRTAKVVVCDMAKMADLQDLVKKTVAAFGRIDGLINNAGVNFVKPFVETTEEEWDHIMDVDLKGTFFLTQLCARQMLKQKPKGGSIVQIASVHTLASLAGAGPYDAAKRGVVGYSKAAAIELAKDNIRVNVLSPGLCKTEIWKDIVAAAPSEKECLAYWNANIPAERLIDPDEIAKCCVFLLSDASSCVTGSNIMADCGMTSLLVSREPYQSKSIGGE
jgi:NAD(P)-dependent dehydrogenase (short-subunit alcohol dehydrogenase family)